MPVAQGEILVYATPRPSLKLLAAARGKHTCSLKERNNEFESRITHGSCSFALMIFSSTLSVSVKNTRIDLDMENRPKGVLVVAIIVFLAAIAALIVAVSILFAGTPLDAIWTLKNPSQLSLGVRLLE